jgi:predicted metallopeptidase
MRYENAPDIQKKAEEICRLLFPDAKTDRIKCFRSYGTCSRGTIARCHGLAKVMQKALEVRAFYVLEFLSERFDKLSEEDKLKTIIHEIMHIPKNFGGGFRHHNVVNGRTVSRMYKLYIAKKEEENGKSYPEL